MNSKKKTYPIRRRDQAEARNKIRAGRSSAQQIAVLDARLGRGMGAVKERKKLQ